MERDAKQRLKQRVKKIADFQAAAGGICLAAALALLALRLGTKYIGEHEPAWAGEMAMYVFVWGIFLESGALVYEKRHFAFEALAEGIKYRRAKQLIVLFDSLVNTFGTAGTGGFAIKNASIGFYNSAYVDSVITVFMLLFGINFNLYFLLLMRDFKQVLKSEELRVYLGTALAAMFLIAFNILPQYSGFGVAFRLSSFQVSSIMTTTGFATADYTMWPSFSQTILFLLMILGACGGSTGGGLKISRAIILVKSLGREVVRMVHPRAVGAVRLDGKRVDDQTTRDVGVFFIAYIFIIFIMTLLVSLDGFGFATTFSAVTACMGNIGPGLGAVGPMGNFADFSVASKLLLSLTMLLGRLEIFPLVLFFTPVLYRKR